MVLKGPSPRTAGRRPPSGALITGTSGALLSTADQKGQQGPGANTDATKQGPQWAGDASAGLSMTSGYEGACLGLDNPGKADSETVLNLSPTPDCRLDAGCARAPARAERR